MRLPRFAYRRAHQLGRLVGRWTYRPLRDPRPLPAPWVPERGAHVYYVTGSGLVPALVLHADDRWCTIAYLDAGELHEANVYATLIARSTPGTRGPWDELDRRADR